MGSPSSSKGCANVDSVQDNGAEQDASTVYESNSRYNLAVDHAHVVIAINSMLCVFA